jgi:hypothetical protein
MEKLTYKKTIKINKKLIKNNLSNGDWGLWI